MNRTAFFTIMAILILASCTSDGGTFDFEKYDELIETNPEEGLKRVKSLRELQDRYDQHHQMLLELLIYKAEDKCYVTHLSDSLISSMCEYFENHGDNYEKSLAYYYKGCTYRDMGDYPLAATWLGKAESKIESDISSRRDSIVLANICGQCSQVCYMTGIYNEAFDKIRKSFEIKRRLNTADFWDYADMGRMASLNDSILLASRCYKQSSTYILQMDNPAKYIDFIGEILCFFSCIGDSSMSSLLANTIVRTNETIKHANVHAALGDYYYNIWHENDSAMRHYQLALGLETNHKKMAELCISISLMQHESGNDTGALRYMLRYLNLMDSVEIAARQAETQTAMARCHTEEINELRQYKKRAQYKFNMRVAVHVSCILALLSAILALLHMNRRRKRLYQHKINVLNTENEKIRGRNDELEHTLRIDTRLRAESAREISDVIVWLNGISYDSQERLMEDSWNIIFDAVDKQYPNFRKSILSLYDAFKANDLILIYLLKLDFKQADISRITKISKSTISRRYQCIEKLIGIPLIELINAEMNNGSYGDNDSQEPIAEKTTD